MNHVFAHCSEEDEIYPLTVKEIVEAKKGRQQTRALLCEQRYPR
jgi:hypothetical protein